MSFTYVTGPMKSGKSLELMSLLRPLEFSDRCVAFIQSERNPREEGILSRTGLHVAARKVMSLAEVEIDFDVVGVDEINMFKRGDAFVIGEWLRLGKDVVVSGLDLNFRGEMFEITPELYKLRPDEIIVKRAVCDCCKQYNAHFTQVLEHGDPIVSQTDYLPEDGTYEYEARCRDCFVPSGDLAVNGLVQHL